MSGRPATLRPAASSAVLHLLLGVANGLESIVPARLALDIDLGLRGDRQLVGRPGIGGRRAERGVRAVACGLWRGGGRRGRRGAELALPVLAPECARSSARLPRKACLRGRRRSPQAEPPQRRTPPKSSALQPSVSCRSLGGTSRDGDIILRLRMVNLDRRPTRRPDGQNPVLSRAGLGHSARRPVSTVFFRRNPAGAPSAPARRRRPGTRLSPYAIAQCMTGLRRRACARRPALPKCMTDA